MTRNYDKRIRIEHAIKAIEAGKVALNHDSITGTVEGSKKTTYEVNTNDNTCRNGLEICRDLEYNCDSGLNQVCYHIIAVKMLKNPVLVRSQ